MTDTMEELGIIIRKPKLLEDIPEELKHLIQSCILDPKEAARTCILSKSWLHAWSTIPTLRFREQVKSCVGQKQRANQLMMVDRTLQRYLRDNIPFETIDLLIDINDQVSDSLTDNWIKPVATRTCVKELSFKFDGHVEAPYTLPGEIFSNENIRKISIQTHMDHKIYIGSNINPPMMIKCVSLRVLDLGNVNITDEVLDNLLSTCSLLEEVKLLCCRGLKTVKVKNLRYLCKFIMFESVFEVECNLELHDVPNLSCFTYSTHSLKNFHSFTIDSLATVTELWLQGVFIDKALVDKINCMSLRVLDLEYVKIREEVLNNLLSTCSLLEEVKLLCCRGLKTIKVKNHPRLCKLMVQIVNLEIFDVPNLSYLNYHSFSQKTYFHSFAKDSLGGSVIDLSLQGVIIDEAFLDMIKLKFCLLQSLTLEIKGWSSESFDITCLSLKKLSLSFKLSPILIKVQVFAPILASFKYVGRTIMPSLLFPALPPAQIQVSFEIDHPMDGLFFVKMREVLMLPSNFDISIWAKFDMALNNIDIDNLRRRFPYPATNVQHLSVLKGSRNNLAPEYSQFFDALFSICHPNVITLYEHKEDNYIRKLMIKEMMETNTKTGSSWPHYLQSIEIKDPHNGNWETLTESSLKSLIDNLACYNEVNEFKLNWRSS